MLPQLQVSSTVKNDIKNAVNQGRIVTIPQTEVTIGEWQGAGYIVLDPDSGSGAYMISGGIAGGSSSWVIDLAALASLIISAVDLYTACAILLSTCLTPLGALIAVVFIALAYVQLVNTMNDLVNYYFYDDPEAVEALITNAVLGLALYGGLAVFRALIPRIKLLSTLCFTGDTLVYTASGYIPIAQVKAGDEVYSYDPDSGQKALKKVKRVHVSETNQLIKLTVGGAEIKVTPPHTFIAIGKGWVAAEALGARDHLLSYSGEGIAVESSEYISLDEPVKVYNFEIEDFHTYCVSDYALVAHNGSCNVFWRLHELGIDPSDYKKYGIVDKETAEAFAEALVRVRELDVTTATIADLRTAMGGYVDETFEIFTKKLGTSYKSNPLRIAYENEVKGLSDLVDTLRSEGKTSEEIARTVSQKRRDLGIEYKDKIPPTLREYIYYVNAQRYQDPLGPTFDWLFDFYEGNYDNIIRAACSPNADVNKLLGGFEKW